MSWKSWIELPESGIVIETKLVRWPTTTDPRSPVVVEVLAWRAADGQMLICLTTQEFRLPLSDPRD